MEGAGVVTDGDRPGSGGDGDSGGEDRREAVVRTGDLTKTFGDEEALRGVSIQVPRGRAYGLIGPDGAGKSTLMKIVSGVLAQDGGRLEVFGREVDSERSAEGIKDRLGFMPQGLGQNLYRELSVDENVDFFARLRDVPAGALAERKERLYSMTRLDRFRDRSMKHLSGGMKQKLGLVCTLIHQPELVILDEPTTGVDPVSRRDFWAILADLLGEGNLTALVSTAYMDEAARFQCFALVYGGRVLLEGSPREVREQAEGSAVRLTTGRPVEALERLQGRFDRVEAYGERLRVFVPDAGRDEAERAVREALGTDGGGDGVGEGGGPAGDDGDGGSEGGGGARGDLLHRLDTEDADLEDVFVTLLQREREGYGEERGEEEREAPPVRFEGSSDPDRPARGELGGNGEPAVRAEGLVKEFGDFRAVDDIHFEVQPGEIFGLLGANGAGKTTAIKMLIGILRPTAGRGRVAGADMRHASRTVKERVGYMSQSFSLYEDLTVAENVRLYGGVYGLGRRRTRRRLDWVLELTGLGERRGARAGSLPVGLRQRLALGCALVHQPPILFLDEPTSGVDPIGRRRFWDLLFRLSREERVAMLVTTHYMQEAEHCDRLALMYAGRIIADGEPDEMKAAVEEDAGALLVVRADRPLAAVDRLRDQGWDGVSLYGEAIHLLAPDPDAARAEIRHRLEEEGIGVQAIQRRPLSMEDVFVYRTLQEEKEAGGDGRAAA